MKKYLIVLLAMLLVVALPVAVYASAEGENSAAQSVETAGPVWEGAGGESAPSEEETGWFASAKVWVLENFSGIVTSAALIYTLFPKWGGLAAVLKVIKSVAAAILAFKKYMDDKNNPDSIYNVLARQGNAMSSFMNDLAPVLLSLQAGVERVEEATRVQEKLCAVLLAVEEAEELMAKEFSDLISISTTISQKHKAELEEKFMQARAHLHNTVREALGDEGRAKETTA